MTGSGDGKGAAVVSISSHVTRGSVGNRAVLFAMEALGFPLWMVPTIHLTWHPGHGPSTRHVVETSTLSPLLSDIARSKHGDEIKAIMTGYFADASQVHLVADWIRDQKATRPDLTYLCDPVLGDAGGLYVAEDVAEAIRDALLPLCDFVTPNLFELAWLCGQNESDDAVSMMTQLPPPCVLATSIPGSGEQHIGNLFRFDGHTHLIEHERFANPPNGTGDLMSAVFLAWHLRGKTPVEAFERAVNATAVIIEKAVLSGADELPLAGNHQLLQALETPLRAVRLPA